MVRFWEKKEGRKIDIIFDKEFEDISFYQIHKSYLPFVGNKYEKYRILQVGESHYIDKNDYGILCDTQKFYDNWWNKKVLGDLENNIRINTRAIIDRYMCKGKNNEKISFDIYDKVLKVFENIFGLEHSRENYNYLAFMNYFQMPSFLYGEDIYKSLEVCGVDHDIDVEKTGKMLRKYSKKIFVAVVNLIKPELIIFTSKLAYKAFVIKEDEEGTLDFDYDVKIECTSHPGCPWWNRSNGKYGREKLWSIMESYKKHLQ